MIITTILLVLENQLVALTQDNQQINKSTTHVYCYLTSHYSCSLFLQLQLLHQTARHHRRLLKYTLSWVPAPAPHKADTLYRLTPTQHYSSRHLLSGTSPLSWLRLFAPRLLTLAADSTSSRLARITRLLLDGPAFEGGSVRVVLYSTF